MSGGLRPNLGGFLLAKHRRNAPRLAPPAECCCSLEAGGGLEFEWFRGGGGQLQWEAVWAVSRRWRNRLHRALHSNIQLVVANVTALSNLRLALAGEPDVVVAQELLATRLQVEAEARLFGYAAAEGQEETYLAAVLFRPGKGQPVKLPFKGE